MKVLVIPDVHLRPWMFEAAAEVMRKKTADKAVCLMDIPDDWGQEYNLNLYEETFVAAVNFQMAFPGALWCYGNHDLSYVWNQMESGFSPLASETVNEGLRKLREALPDSDQIAYIHRIDNVLFSHGGLTDPFVKYYVPSDKRDNVDAVIKTVNGLGCHEMWDDASPLWLRPQYYPEKMYKQEELLQVVGHTPVESITEDWNIISCDVFSTYRDGSPIGTEEFLLIDTATFEYAGIKARD